MLADEFDRATNDGAANDGATNVEARKGESEVEVNWGAALVWSIVACVLISVGGFYWHSSRLLQGVKVRLIEENRTLTMAQERLSPLQPGKMNAEDARLAFASLHRDMPSDSGIGRRIALLVSAHALHGDSPIDRLALSNGEASRWQDATEEPRFWAGAFVFMGLLGTLAGLAVSVVHLMTIVNSSGGGSQAFGDKMATVLPTMRDTFASMGGAFASTAVGVLATLLLSYSIHRTERSIDECLRHLETLSLTYLELLIHRIHAAMPAGQDAVASHMLARVEQICSGFTETLKGAAGVLVRINDATTQNAARWESAAASFEATVERYEMSATKLATGIDSLENLYTRAEEERRDASAALAMGLSQIETTLGQIHTAVSAAENLFAHLDGYQQGLQTEHKKLLDAVEERISRSQQNLGETSQSLQGDIAGLTRMLGEQMRESQKVWREAYFSLQQEWPKSVAHMNEILQENVAEERRIAAMIEETLSHVRNYAEHVESVVHDLPATLQAGPLIAYDREQSEAFIGLSNAVTQSADAMGRGASAVGEALSQVTVLRQEISGLNETLRTFGGVLAQVQAEQKSAPSLSEGVEQSTMQLSALSSKVGQLDRHLEELLQHPTIILPPLRRPQK